MKTPNEGIVDLPIQINRWKMLTRNLISSFEARAEFPLEEGRKGVLPIQINEVILIERNKEKQPSVISSHLDTLAQMIDLITKDKKGTSLMRMFQNLSAQISESSMWLLYGTYESKKGVSKNIAFMYICSLNVCMYSMQRDSETKEQFFAKYQMN